MHIHSSSSFYPSAKQVLKGEFYREIEKHNNNVLTKTFSCFFVGFFLFVLGGERREDIHSSDKCWAQKVIRNRKTIAF